MRVPLVDVAAQERAVADEALAAIAQVARAGRFVLGARVEAFEAWLARECGARYAVGVASGTDAIELSLRALGVGAGDAVVTPAFSFVAAAEAIAAAGARPVFCDVDAETMNASAETIDAAIARAKRAGLRVRAVVPVHLFGLCAPMRETEEVARRAGIAVVEDAAQAIGARDGAGRAAGSIGDTGCFSFFPTKNLGAWGDGGAVVTSRRDVADAVRRLRAHGAVKPYVHASLGRNSRLDEVQAAVLLSKAKHLPMWHSARARIAAKYREAFAALPLRLPHAAEAPATHAWHAFVVRTERRDALAEHLQERGIETRVYYPVPLHRQPVFEDLAEVAHPIAEEACRTALALPMFATMTVEQRGYVVEQVARFFARLTPAAPPRIPRSRSSP